MRGKMTYTDFYEMFAEACYLSKKDAKPCYERLKQKIFERMDEDEEFILPDIGKIYIHPVSARTLTNYHTGKLVRVPETKRLAFMFDKGIKKKYKSTYKLMDIGTEVPEEEDK